MAISRTNGGDDMTNEIKFLNASEAASSAAQYLEAMMPQAESILLEEVEQLAEKSKTFWLITLSFQLNMSGLPGGLRLGYQHLGAKRDYKTFKIDAASGEVIAMKIKAV